MVRLSVKAMSALCVFWAGGLFLRGQAGLEVGGPCWLCILTFRGPESGWTITSVDD